MYRRGQDEKEVIEIEKEKVRWMEGKMDGFTKLWREEEGKDRGDKEGRERQYCEKEKMKERFESKVG